ADQGDPLHLKRDQCQHIPVEMLQAHRGKCQQQRQQLRHQHQQKDGLGCAEIRQKIIARRTRTCHVVILVIAQNSTPGGCAESDLTGNEYCVLGCGCVSDYAALIRPTELWLFVGLRLRLIRPTKLANVDLVAERVGRISAAYSDMPDIDHPIPFPRAGRPKTTGTAQPTTRAPQPYVGLAEGVIRRCQSNPPPGQISGSLSLTSTTPDTSTRRQAKACSTGL